MLLKLGLTHHYDIGLQREQCLYYINFYLESYLSDVRLKSFSIDAILSLGWNRLFGILKIYFNNQQNNKTFLKILAKYFLTGIGLLKSRGLVKVFFFLDN